MYLLRTQEVVKLKTSLEEAEQRASVLKSKLNLSEAQVASLRAEVTTWKRKRCGTSGNLDSNVRMMIEELERLGKLAEQYLIG
jgi:multidrug resistance efflux pump